MGPAGEQLRLQFFQSHGSIYWHLFACSIKDHK